MVIYSGMSHEKWWFSIATLVYQRVLMFSQAFTYRFWSIYDETRILHGLGAAKF